MFSIGIWELLIIAAILCFVIGIPIVAAIVVVWIANRSRSDDKRDAP